MTREDGQAPVPALEGPGEVDLQESNERWRDWLLRRLYFVLCVLAAVYLLVNVRTHLIGESDPLHWQFLVALVAFIAVIVAAFARRISRQQRAGTIAFAVLLACSASLAANGFLAPNGLMVVLTCSVLLTVAAGPKLAWMMLGAFLVVLVGFAVYFSNPETSLTATILDVHEPLNWVRVILNFGLISSAAVYATAALITRLETALTRSERWRAQLVEESERRVAALEAQRAAEQKMQQAQRTELLGRLAAAVAHDFNNLLVVIINNAELLQGTAGADGQEELREIADAGLRGAELAHQLLALGRQQVVERRALELDEAVESSLRLVRRLLRSDIELEQNLATAGAHVHLAKLELDQVLMNLCINARDAMPSGGVLTVRTELPTDRSDMLCLSVEDTGTGMTEETRQHLFEPFFTTKEFGKGTGLGMSVVQGVIEQCGGKLEIASRLGSGTTFTIWLPRAVVATGAADAPPPRARNTESSKATILVADDDPGVLNVIQRTLVGAGYSVIPCRNGAEAFSKYLENRSSIALVVTDSVMPFMGGRELYERLHVEDEHLPVLFCSGYTQGTLSAQFFEHPQRALLAKPFRSEELLNRVAELLETRPLAIAPEVRKMGTQATLD